MITNEELFQLIDECRKRGVTHLKLNRLAQSGYEQSVEFTVAQVVAPGDPLAAITAPAAIDHSKCLNCQKAPQERSALCRACWLGQAGVTS